MSSYCLTDSDKKNWLDDPELFLYAKGTGPDDVHLWRCKKPASSSSSSSLVVPMKSDDFDYVSNVKNHEELIGYLFNWDETDYNRLVKYIYEKRLLVNNQGFVIAELLHKADKDANKTIDDANEEDVPAAIYIRSLDVLRLKPYIPDLTEPPIPLRMVKYLGDVNGEAAMMEDNSKVTKLTTRVENLEAENTRLESKNNTLDQSVTKLTSDLTAITADLAATTHKVVGLESGNKILEEKVRKLEENVGKLILYSYEMDPGYKEVWMSDHKQFDWVQFEGLRDIGDMIFTYIEPQSSYKKDSTHTNVRATYYRHVQALSSTGSTYYDHTAISVEVLTPCTWKARFNHYSWNLCKFQGKVYAIAGINIAPR